ncbi:helix-turn-helix transcriptional regulator [Paenibacillus solisilvae]|uniref:Helix-turn-helix transcriptional regulator n=1 Tax=Paenibacillus solisilvae TaxID=2486751 RepID=A0ABW0W6G4_9BACL
MPLMHLNELKVQVPPLPHFLTAGKDVFGPGMKHVERHMIGIFDLIVVSKGTLYMGEDGTDIQLDAGQALILRPDLHHYPTKACEAETRFYWLHFQVSSPWMEKHETAPFQLSSMPGLDTTSLNNIGNQYQFHLPRYLTLSNPLEMYSELEGLLNLLPKTDLLSCWKQQTAFHHLLFRMCGDSQLDRPDSAIVKLAERTASFLKENYRMMITNELLRGALHYHPIYITRCMRTVFGCTPNEYVNEYRIEQAKMLLLTTDRSIAAVSSEVGFDDPPYFSRRFRSSTGMNPRDYRNQFVLKGKK